MHGFPAFQCIRNSALCSVQGIFPIYTQNLICDVLFPGTTPGNKYCISQGQVRQKRNNVMYFNRGDSRKGIGTVALKGCKGKKNKNNPLPKQKNQPH